MRKLFKSFLRNQDGATAIEYGLIAVVIIGGVTAVGTKLSASFNTVQSNLK
jgi:pilus assembly protein Flp/PilA